MSQNVQPLACDDSFIELELSHHAPASMQAYAINPVASGGDFHLRYDGAVCVILSEESQLLAVNLVRSIGTQALTGHNLMEMLSRLQRMSTLSPLGDR